MIGLTSTNVLFFCGMDRRLLHEKNMCTSNSQNSVALTLKYDTKDGHIV